MPLSDSAPHQFDPLTMELTGLTTPTMDEKPSEKPSEEKPSSADGSAPQEPTKPFGPLVLGPSTATERALIKGMGLAGIEQEEFPDQLKDKVVKRGRRGPSGQIVVRRISGIENNVAKRITKQFEANTLGRDDIIEKLEAAAGDGALNERDSKALALLRTSARSKSLAHILADAKTEPLSIMRAYARGCVVLGQVQAAIEAHSRMPALVKDIFRHAMDQTGVCGVCVGSGRVPRRAGGNMESKDCPNCTGTGEVVVSSEHKPWAAKVALEMTGQIKGPGGPTVNVQQNVNVAGPGAGFMETLLKATDKVLFGQAKPAEIVEAEVVAPDRS